MYPRLTFLLVFSLFLSSLIAQPFDQPAPLSAHLSEINKHWSTLPTQPTIVAFASDEDRIQAHLFGVYQALKSNTPADLSPEQLDNRARLLAQLKRYATERKFPKNTGHSVRTPYFIDQFNTPCAVANLILQAGDQALAESLRLDYNFNYIAEMPQQPLQAWADENGFEAWELAWIQPGYSYFPTTRFQQRNMQLNTEVNQVEYLDEEGLTCYATNGENIYASCFTCLTNDGTFKDYGALLNGNAISFIPYFLHDFIVAGAFTRNDSTFGLASVNFQEAPTYWEIPGRDSYITRSIVKRGSTIYFSAEVSADSTFVYSWNPGQPNLLRMLFVNGQVNSLILDGLSLFVGGEFTEARNQNDTIECNNIVSISGGNLSSMNQGFAGKVNKLRMIDSTIYAVGTCKGQDSSSCAVKWVNNEWQRLISDSLAQTFYSESNEAEILDIISHGDSLLIGTNFDIYSGSVMYYYPGKGLLQIDTNGAVLPKAYINGSVNSMTINGDGLLEVGGDFQSYIYHHPQSTGWISYANEELAYSGKIAYGLVGTEVVPSQIFKVYPNPASQLLNVQFNYNIDGVNLYDITGKQISAPFSTTSNTAEIDVNELPSGLYIIEAKSDGKLIRKEFIVE